MKDRRENSFERFYFAKVGLGEGCGCAERVIDVHEFNRLAGRTAVRKGFWPRKGSFRRFLDKAGLSSRPARHGTDQETR